MTVVDLHAVNVVNEDIPATTLLTAKVEPITAVGNLKTISARVKVRLRGTVVNPPLWLEDLNLHSPLKCQSRQNPSLGETRTSSLTLSISLIILEITPLAMVTLSCHHCYLQTTVERMLLLSLYLRSRLQRRQLPLPGR